MSPPPTSGMYSPSQFFIPQSCPRARIVGKKAFTLIELLMVFAVITILAAITFGITRGVKERQNRAKAKAELAILSQALEQFKARNGDYPWSVNGDPSSAEDNGERLFQALTGWGKFTLNGSQPQFDLKTSSDVSKNGPKPFVDVSKLTYVNPADPDEYNPDVGTSSAPANYVFIDPWGEPYVFLYAKEGGAWELFGYHLYSKAGDLVDSNAGLNATTGAMSDSYRDEDENIDNIYAGE